MSLVTVDRVFFACWKFSRISRFFRKNLENIQPRKLNSGKIYYRQKKRGEEDNLKKRQKIRVLFVFNVFGCVLESWLGLPGPWAGWLTKNKLCWVTNAFLCFAMNCKLSITIKRNLEIPNLRKITSRVTFETANPEIYHLVKITRCTVCHYKYSVLDILYKVIARLRVSTNT